VVQACNPPDIFWPLAWWLRWRDGTAFVFDHHDLCPELYDARFPNGGALRRRGLLALERATFATADHVVSTNESYAEIARTRGAKRECEVTVVRTGPDPASLQRSPVIQYDRRGRVHLVAYIGVMGPQDGVDLAIRAAAHVVHELGRDDVTFTFMGGGDCWDELVCLRDRLGLRDYVDLPGRVPDAVVCDALSAADMGLCPDPKNQLNDLSTMNKTMEYMAFGLPVVAFDLKETRVSAGEAARYVLDGDIAAYGQAIVNLLDDPPARTRMGRAGRARIEEELGWPHQADRYVEVYNRLTGTDTMIPSTNAVSVSASVRSDSGSDVERNEEHRVIQLPPSQPLLVALRQHSPDIESTVIQLPADDNEYVEQAGSADVQGAAGS
jgi:glycosyltransferase involved in cell wall biosynthesis